MTEPTEETQVDVAAKAADVFVESFYNALNSPTGRSKLTSFYIKPSALAPAEAVITLNGNIIPNPAALQEMFEKKVEKTAYDAQSYDAHVINTNYNIGVEEGKLVGEKDGGKMSIVVVVNGAVKYISKNGDEGDERAFVENFVLVPNMEARNPKAPKGIRKWLIQSQIFRLVL
ncbi:hypothetical protein ACMFMG_007734 [Clarireedia jacksonii]